MAAKSDHAETETLRFWLVLGDIAPTRPTAITVQLGNLSGTDTFSPVSTANGYPGAQSATFTTITTSGTTKETVNTNQITFGPSSGSWTCANASTNINGFCVYGTISGSPTELYMGTLDNARTVSVAGETITIAVGNLKVRES